MRYNTLKLIEDSNRAPLRLLAVDHIRRLCSADRCLDKRNRFDGVASDYEWGHHIFVPLHLHARNLRIS